MSEIKPCPFCGSKGGDRTEPIGPSVTIGSGRVFVSCAQCGARGPTVKSDDHTRDEYVIGRWNNRVVSVTVRERSPFLYEDEA